VTIDLNVTEVRDENTDVKLTYVPTPPGLNDPVKHTRNAGYSRETRDRA